MLPQAISYPEGVTYNGFRVVALKFDFENRTNQLILENWKLFDQQTIKDAIALRVPYIKCTTGILFTLFEVQFYSNLEDYYQTCNDLEKAMFVVTII